MSDQDAVLQLLREIRDHQAEALALQREQLELYRRQWERAERINAKAEALQDRGAGMVRSARWLIAVIVVIVGFLFGLMFWRYL